MIKAVTIQTLLAIAGIVAVLVLPALVVQAMVHPAAPVAALPLLVLVQMVVVLAAALMAEDQAETLEEALQEVQDLQTEVARLEDQVEALLAEVILQAEVLEAEGLQKDQEE